MKFSDIKFAIARSKSHDEIAIVEVADKYAAYAEAKAVAKAAGYDFGGTDSNEGLECWACPMDRDEMVWRLDIRIG